MNLKFRPVKITDLPDQTEAMGEDRVTEQDALEIADRIQSALAKVSDIAALAIITDALVDLYRQYGFTPALTLRAIGESVAYASGHKVKVDLVRREDIERRVARAPLGHTRTPRRRS